MTAESRASIISKLNKLKAFVERDCGNETINAQRIINRLVVKYGITSSEFSYEHFSVKARRDATQCEQRRKKDTTNRNNKKRLRMT